MKKIAVVFLILLSGLMACTPTNRSIASVVELEIVQAPRFSAVSEFSFPDFVEVTLESGEKVSVPVTWDSARDQYDASRIGAQTIRGRFLLSDIDNPSQLRPAVTIQLTAVDWLTTLEKTPEFSLLYRALIRSQIDLSAYQTFTLFAPTNQAFETLLGFLNLSFEAFLESDALEPVLLYHLLEGSFSAQDLLKESPNLIDSVEGTPLTLNFDGEFITINVINRVIRASEPNTDQTIHRIDGVLLPPNTFAGDLQSVLNTQALNLFVDLLGDVDINITQLLGSGFTIFAPNQAAFEAYAAERNLTLAQLAQDPDIADLLLRHIVQDEISYDQLLFSAPFTLETLSGDTLTVTLIDNQVAINGVIIESSDTTAAIATIHTISRILPENE